MCGMQGFALRVRLGAARLMTEPPPKMQKTGKVIGTHSGSFHCEALSSQLDFWMSRLSLRFCNSHVSRISFSHSTPNFTNDDA